MGTLPELSNFYCHPGRAGGLPNCNYKSNTQQETGDFRLVAADVKRPQQQERLRLYRRPRNERLLRQQANLVESFLRIKKRGWHLIALLHTLIKSVCASFLTNSQLGFKSTTPTTTRCVLCSTLLFALCAGGRTWESFYILLFFRMGYVNNRRKPSYGIAEGKAYDYQDRTQQYFCTHERLSKGRMSYREMRRYGVGFPLTAPRAGVCSRFGKNSTSLDKTVECNFKITSKLIRN